MIKMTHSDRPIPKKLHLLLAFGGEEALKRGTWPLKTSQIVPPLKSSDVCVFFMRLSPGFICAICDSEGKHCRLSNGTINGTFSSAT